MRQKLLVLLALALVTFSAHWRVLQNDFVNYDDNDYVTANPVVHQGLTKEGVAWAFGNLHGPKTYWHPLTWLSHMADVELFGLKPAGHHAMSLLFHTLNVLLLFLVLERMTGARWRSAIVAALWAVHPLQVDTVAWVTERKNELAALFWLLTMAAYLRYAAKPTLARYLLVPLGMALGLMCKPVLVTLPCGLLLLDFWPLKRWKPRSWEKTAESATPPFVPVSLRRLLLEKVPLLVLSLASSLVTLAAHNRLGIREDVFGLTLGLKIQNALVSYVRYIDNAIWPSKLTVLYLHPGEWPNKTVTLSAFVLLVITLIVLRSARTRPHLCVGWLWFLGVLVPMIGLRQAGVHAMADRFAYLPLIGLLVMVVWTAADWFIGPPRKTVAAAATAAAAITAYAIVSNFQTGHWRNSETLWTRALAINPNNYLAHGNLSVTYLVSKNFERARHHANEAVRIRPVFVEQHAQLGMIALAENNPEEARQHFDRALRSRPDAPGVFRNLALFNARLAMVSGEPSNLDPAIAMLFASVTEMPADVEARSLLASLLAARGRAAEAAEQYREILRRQPDLPYILNDFAWLLAANADAAVRNGAEAVRLAERACELTGRRQALLLGTLAAAYAEAGRFEDAIRTAQQAITEASAMGQINVVERNRQLIDLYRAGKAYHEPPAVTGSNR